jgi:hypothetical protein
VAPPASESSCNAAASDATELLPVQRVLDWHTFGVRRELTRIKRWAERKSISGIQSVV